MAVQGNWVISNWLLVAGMKTNSFAIFNSTQSHILAPKDPNKEFLKQYFNFQSI